MEKCQPNTFCSLFFFSLFLKNLVVRKNPTEQTVPQRNSQACALGNLYQVVLLVITRLERPMSLDRKMDTTLNYTIHTMEGYTIMKINENTATCNSMEKS